VSTASECLGLQEPLSIDKFSPIVDFMDQAGLSQAEMRRTNGFWAAIFSMIIWCLANDKPEIVSSDQKHPFNLGAGEIPIMMIGSVVYSQETTIRSRQGGYSGASVPLGHGVYYHFGGFKSQAIEKAVLKEIDYGQLLLTTQNMYFGGDHKTFRLAYNHVLRFEPYIDGLGFFRDSSTAKAEVFKVVPPSLHGPAGWFLFNLAHLLAMPEARSLYGRARK
jgi:hypothetical protein